MNVAKLLAIVSTCLFIVAFILVIVGGGHAKTVEDLTLLGFATLAGAHAL